MDIGAAIPGVRPCIISNRSPCLKSLCARIDPADDQLIPNLICVVPPPGTRVTRYRFDGHGSGIIAMDDDITAIESDPLHRIHALAAAAPAGGIRTFTFEAGPVEVRVAPARRAVRDVLTTFDRVDMLFDGHRSLPPRWTIRMTRMMIRNAAATTRLPTNRCQRLIATGHRQYAGRPAGTYAPSRHCRPRDPSPARTARRP